MRDLDPRLGTRRWPWAAGLAVLGALVVADRSGWLLVRHPDDMTVYHGAAARVTRVVDGAVIEIDLADPMHRRPVTPVRLWGVASPPAAVPGRPEHPFADEARALTAALAQGRTVVLALEAHRTRGPFGLILAHVQLDDGSSLNEALLEAGLGRCDERWPHSLLGRYAQIERDARRRGAGLWAGEPSPDRGGPETG